MAHEFSAEGDFVSYTNPGPNTVAAGEFVLNAGNTVVLGLAPRAIPPNTTGSLYRRAGGLINVDKLAADVFTPGTLVNLVVASKLVSVGAGVAVGRCMSSAAAGTTKALIALAI